jgi:hypothetical protein
MLTIGRLIIAFALTAMPLASIAMAADGDCRLIRGATTPDDPSDDLSVCRKDTWFHQADTKVGNLAGFGQGAFPSWNTTKPTASATTGAGGGYATNSIFHQAVGAQDPRGSAVFQGTYTGVLDNLAVSLYAFVAPVFSNELNVELTIDGEPIHAGSAEMAATPGENQIVLLKFVFTNVYKVLEGLQKQGDALTTHQVELAVNGVYIINDPAVFVYDTSEVPSGISFNLDGSLSSYTKIDVFAG